MNDPAAIKALEVTLGFDTTLTQTDDEYTEEGLRRDLYCGATYAPNAVRPIFQIIADHPGGKAWSRTPNPCPACHDFSRSWNCPEHPERDIDWESRVWPAQPPRTLRNAPLRGEW